MDMKAKEQYIVSALTAKGIFTPEDIEAEKKRLLASVTDSVAQQQGLVTDVDKIYFALTANAPQVPAASVTATTVANTKPADGATTAELIHITKQLANTEPARNIVSTNTTISALVLDKMDPKDLIPAGATFVADKTKYATKWDEWEKNLAPDDNPSMEGAIASRANFDTLKAAVEAGTPIAVSIKKLNTTPKAFVLSKANATGAGNTEEVMGSSEFQEFMTLESNGYILATPSTPGAKLRYAMARKNAQQKDIPARIVVQITNKKEAIEAGSYDISVQKVAGETAKMRVSSDLVFKIVDPEKKTKDGKPVTRKVAITGQLEVPKTERKTRYVDVLGSVDKSTNKDLLNMPDKVDLAKIRDQQARSIAHLMQQAQNDAAVGARISSKLATFSAAKNEAVGAQM